MFLGDLKANTELAYLRPCSKLFHSLGPLTQAESLLVTVMFVVGMTSSSTSEVTDVMWSKTTKGFMLTTKF